MPRMFKLLFKLADIVNFGMETLSGPTIEVRACHSPINNSKHKRTANDYVNLR